MYKFQIGIMFFLSICACNTYSQISNITPFIYDIKGVNVYEDVVIAFGNYGVASLSFDKGKSWKDIQVDAEGNIVNLVHKNNSLIAFLEDGDVKTSDDNGVTWKFKIRVADTIISSKVNTNYSVIRTQHNLFVLNNEYKITAKLKLEYNYKVRYESKIAFVNEPPLQIDDSKIYTFLDSNVLIYDMGLKLLEQISVGKSEYGILRIYLANNSIYVRVNNNLIEIDEDRNISSFLKFDKNIDLFSESDPIIYYLRVFNNKLFSLNALQNININAVYSIYQIDSEINAKRLGQADCSTIKNNLIINDFGKYQEDFYFVSNSRFIVKYNLVSKESDRISDLTNFNNSGGYLPIRIEDDKALYRNGNNYFTLNSKTNKVIKIDTDTDFSHVNILYENYDKKINKLQILGYNPISKNELLIFSSKNLGESFHKDTLISDEPLNYVQITGFEKLDNGYMISSYYKTYFSQKNEFKIFDDNFNMISITVDSLTKNLKTGFTNSGYYRINQDTSFFKKTYIQTSKDGIIWEDLLQYSYSKPDTVWLDDVNYYAFSTPDYRSSGLVETKEKNYLINFIYSENDSLFTVQKIDIESKNIDTLIHNKVLTYDYGITDAFDYFKDTLNIVVNDTLYLLNINDDVSRTEKLQFPDNGFVVQRYYKRFESKSLFTYLDDKHEVRNYWFILNRKNGINSIKEDDLFVIPYLYNSLPYPQPTTNLVTVDVYLESGRTLKTTDIEIYNINGILVERGNNIIITGNNWPTKLTWDSSEQPSGVYFIVMKYGETTKSVKVIKE